MISHVLPLLVIVGLLILLAYMSRSPENFMNDTTGELCKPDGTFTLSFDDNDYNPWQGGSVFAINLSYGSYSFHDAKLIDVCWDVVSAISLLTPRVRWISNIG